MARQDVWTSAIPSVLELSEYSVVPHGLKNLQKAFQANINAYIQPSLGQRYITYVENVDVCNADLGANASSL